MTGKRLLVDKAFSKYFLALASAILAVLAVTALSSGPTTAAPSQTALAAVSLVAEGFAHPVALAEPPDGSGRLFIVDQTGQIWIVTADGTLLPDPFLDIEERLVNLNAGYDERGLLGLAFHPDYASNGRFFVFYSAPLREEGPNGWSHTNVIAEYDVSGADANRADSGSEEIVMEIDWPQGNHDGGTLAFGPDDGYLYISLGDGGGGGDDDTGHVEDWYAENGGGNGQDIEANLLGSILRIDVGPEGATAAYTVPSDNPFVGQTPFPEQWAYGFRNPYRFSFDMGGNHNLFAGDAGQNLWEEVDLVTAGGNYGWNVKEGAHCFDAENPTTPPDECPDAIPENADHPDAGAPLLDPIIEFANSAQPGGLGNTVIGGHVYRGDLLPAWDGSYLFGVFSNSQGVGDVFLATPDGQGGWPYERLTMANLPDGRLQDFLLSFGQDLEGEVYLLTTAEVGPTGTTGRVWRITPPFDRYLPGVLNAASSR
ncbi:MAG: PQQ-dependent sugar dehydrogenase [Candidatus Promineifilaceae bacterium]|nr:PQQ-dependent sugar dehydrogenase [Candidatus Promineifilaceae bacterium]